MNKNKRVFFVIGLIRFAFPIAERIVPFFASKWASKLFFSPFRFQTPERELKVLNQAQKFTVSLNTIDIHCYEWGSGPAILLMHGWAGRAGQFGEIIKSLANSGFKAIAFDAPAHGFTRGKRTHILEFADSIRLINKEKGPFVGVIGHSLGGSALLLSVKNGLKTEKIVTISVPSIGDKVIEEFLQKINASVKMKEEIKASIYKKFNVLFDDFSARKIVEEGFPSQDFLIIHDKDDREAPMYHFEELNKKLPHARTLITEGLGHNKVLRDNRVISEIIEFLNSETKVKIRNNTKVVSSNEI